MPSLPWLVVAALAVFRVTHLLHAEDGPWDLSLRLRRRAGQGFFASLLDCFYCLSLWVAAPVAYVVADDWKARLLLWPALSAGAIVIERLTNRAPAAPPAVYREDEEETDELLRKGSERAPRDARPGSER